MSETAPRLRLLIADDCAPLMAALEQLLSPYGDVVGRVTDGAGLLSETERLRPDVLLLDLHLPNVNSLAVCKSIRSTMPRTKVIVLTAGMDTDVRRGVLAAGASAFIDKLTAVRELPAAIATAAQEG